MLNATKRELVKDFQSALEFDQSTMFKKVYEEEFGTFGGAPYGTLIGDFEISRQPEDVYFLEQMSHVAAASHAPFITSTNPELFGVESFGDLGKPRDLAKVFDTAEYAKWKAFRDSEDSRYVGLTLPRFLGRLPYHPADGMTVEGFNYVEDVDGSDHSKYLWCNAAYAFGARLTQAFEDYGWCAAIRGVEGGGLVENIPRVLADNLTAVLDGSSWTMPPLFQWLQQHGGVADAEMHRVFNCGIGMTVIVSKENADAAFAQLQAAGETVYRIGEIRARAEGQAQTVVE